MKPVTLTPDDINLICDICRDYARERWDHARRTKSASIRAYCETTARKAAELEARIVCAAFSVDTSSV